MESYVQAGECGHLTLYRSKLPFEIPAEAAYTDDAEVAFVYRFDSDDERTRLDVYLSTDPFLSSSATPR